MAVEFACEPWGSLNAIRISAGAAAFGSSDTSHPRVRERPGRLSNSANGLIALGAKTMTCLDHGIYFWCPK
jgi:hypothetical protein